ncbi:T-complex protein 1 subunit eta [Diplodia intermedia]|uniref:CCT-eta n=1 Tax=Diplodia intermedia TaxID=856260 RepID=A0ABR3TCU6_9PEZI
MSTTHRPSTASAGEAEKQSSPRDPSYESDNLRQSSTRDVEKGADPTVPAYDGETKRRRRSSASVMVGRSDPFGDETNAEIKYRTMSWWHASMTIGIVPGVILIAGLGILATYTGYTIHQFKMAYPHVHNMADVGEVLFSSWGPTAAAIGRETLGAAQTIFLIFSMGSHILTFTIAMNAITEHVTCTLVWGAVGLVVLWFCTLPRTLKKVSYLSIASFISIGAAVIITMAGVGAAPPDPHVDVTIKTSLASAFLSTTNIVFAYAGHVAFFTFISELKDPREFPKALFTLQAADTSMYIIVAVVVYRYSGPDVASPALGSTGNVVKRVAYGIALPTIVIAGVIYGHVAAKYIYVRAFKGSRHMHSRTWLGFGGWAAITLVIWVIAWVIAESIPNFNTLLGLISSIFASWFTYGLSGIFWLFINWDGSGKKGMAGWFAGGKKSALAVLNLVIVAIGAAVMGLGLYASGTDQSQGRGQIISNINACLAVQETIKSTLGPYGGDLLLVDENGRQTITNDGATVMKLLDIVHPAARILTDIARSQDAEVGDGTTSVVVLAGEVLKEIKDFVEQGVSSQTIIKGLRRASQMAVNKIKEIAVNTTEANQRDTLQKLAATAMSSKLIHRNADFFTKLVVDAVLTLDQDDLNENLIGMKKVTGGALQDSLFVNGVAFKKTFSYAGFEQQPKSFKDPKIVCLNVELELKAEKDNAEVRVEQVSEYQAIVDAEWQIIFNKMEALHKTGAKIVLSKLPIGDLATQYFADRDIFCAGRVAAGDMERVCKATGASIQSTCSDIREEYLGTCEKFNERQIGNERFNFFEGCPAAKTCTLVLRGGAEQFIAEVERSLHDAIMIVKRAIKHQSIVAGGGACEMEVSAYLHAFADKNVPHKQQGIIKAFAKALEVVPRQLCDNAGFDATDILNRLRVEHRKGNIWAGVDFINEGIADNMEHFVWEPALVKVNAIQAAIEAACLILSVDETIKNQESQQPQAPQRGLPPGAAQRALRGRGRGMPRR